MKLTHKQKKFIKKNRQKMSVAAMAGILGVSEKDVLPLVPEKILALKTNARKGAAGTLSLAISDFSFKEWWREYWPFVILVVVLGLAVYLNGLFAGFTSDDIPALVTTPPRWSEWGGLINNPSGFIRQTLYVLTYQLFGSQPFIYRLPNLIAHLISSVLVLLIVSVFTNKKVAIFAAGMFAVHPLLVESVTWISGGGYAHFTMFLLFSFWWYLRGSCAGWKFLVLANVAFLLALLSSEKALFFPLLLVLMEVLRGNFKRGWPHVVSFFVLGGAFGLYYISHIGSRLADISAPMAGDTGGAYYNPLLQVPIALTSYMRYFVWPFGLSLYHSDILPSQLQLGFIWLLLAGLLGLYVWTFFKNKFLFFWASWFWLALLPVLTPFKIAWVVAERYAYFAVIGLCVIAAWLLVYLFKRWQRFYLDWIALGIVLIFLASLTVLRNIDWWNEDNLWFATAKTAPLYPNTHNNLGDVYSRRGDLPNAIAEFTRATELNPAYADAYHNLGQAYKQNGQPDKALENYDKAIQYNPNLWQSYQAKAILVFEQGDTTQALDLLDKARDISPRNLQLEYNYGVILAQVGKLTEAQTQFEQILEWDPGDEKIVGALEQIRAEIMANESVK